MQTKQTEAKVISLAAYLQAKPLVAVKEEHEPVSFFKQHNQRIRKWTAILLMGIAYFLGINELFSR